jgi:2-polyprenyl-3-methyl-5-hydroxy-6-metoxy-1,4-benzoquinol methylase
MDNLRSAAAREPVTAAVARLYDTYPFPPEPLLDEPPPGYNWRWYWPTVHSFCTGAKPAHSQVRVLDAGCGTGVSTEYLAHLNPAATVLGIDLSGQALATAAERCRRSQASNVSFRQLSLYDVDQLPGQFDWINCVGVLHHLPDPLGGLQALASKLAPGGLIHLFVYAAIGRWEISLMQRAISLVQGDRRGDYRDGVAVGRQLFASLPPENRLRKREEQRWSLENQRDECFADMYVHPQEVDYTMDMLFELIEGSGLEFVGFSNPAVWRLERLLGSDPALLQRAEALPTWDRYRLVSLLDPEITHFEWFLAKPPRPRWDWKQDGSLLTARVERNPCMEGWPSQRIFNHNYEMVTLSAVEFEVLQACDRANSSLDGGTGEAPGVTGAEILATTQASLADLGRMQEDQLILVTPEPGA